MARFGRKVSITLDKDGLVPPVTLAWEGDPSLTKRLGELERANGDQLKDQYRNITERAKTLLSHTQAASTPRSG